MRLRHRTKASSGSIVLGSLRAHCSRGIVLWFPAGHHCCAQRAYPIHLCLTVRKVSKVKIATAKTKQQPFVCSFAFVFLSVRKSPAYTGFHGLTFVGSFIIVFSIMLIEWFFCVESFRNDGCNCYLFCCGNDWWVCILNCVLREWEMWSFFGLQCDFVFSGNLNA